LRYLLLGFLLLLFFGIANAQTDSGSADTPTQEAIQNYESDIKIRKDGRLKVTETITVFNTEGGDLKRGIYRYFPNPDFEVTSVKRDGDRATYRTEVNDGRKRIEIWKKDVYLDPGSYTYQIQYLTDQQIEYKGSQEDLLYWNVTGQNWGFPIQQVEVEIILPKEIPSDEITLNAFTVYEGIKGQSYQAKLEGNKANFRTTKSLKKREDLSIVVLFPSGFVESTDNTPFSFPAWIVFLFIFLIWGLPCTVSIIDMFDNFRDGENGEDTRRGKGGGAAAGGGGASGGSGGSGGAGGGSGGGGGGGI
jgi:hypothetical protein